MAKSKEQKRADALNRKRAHYINEHLSNFINCSPIGSRWQGGVADMLWFINQLAVLRRLSDECVITLSGNPNTYDMFSFWSVREMFNHLIVAGTIHSFCGECNDNRESAGLTRINVDPVDVWGSRLKQCLELAENPRVKELLNNVKP